MRELIVGGREEGIVKVRVRVRVRIRVRVRVFIFFKKAAIAKGAKEFGRRGRRDRNMAVALVTEVVLRRRRESGGRGTVAAAGSHWRRCL